MRLYGANTEPHKAENSTLQENRTLADDNSLTLSDTIQADFSLEDKCMPNTIKANYGALLSVLQAIERTA